MANILDYFDSAMINTVKNVIVQAPSKLLYLTLGEILEASCISATHISAPKSLAIVEHK